MAEVGLDGSGFQRGLSNLGRSAANSVKGMVLGAFGIYGIEQAIRKTIESAGELVTASKRLDMTIEQLQILRQAAKDNGVEFGKLETAFEKLNIWRDKFLAGDPAAAKAALQFGITPQMARTQTAAQLSMGPIASVVSKENSAQVATSLKEVFSKGFGELIPFLKTDFDDLGSTMKKFGLLMDTESAVKLKFLSDEFSLLSNIISSELAPELISLADGIFSAVGKLKEFGAYLGSLAGSSSTGGLWGIIKDKLKADYARETLEHYRSGMSTVTPEEAAEAGRFLQKYDKGIENRKAEAGKAANDVADTWKKLGDLINAKLAKAIEDSKNPKPIFSPETVEAKAKALPKEHDPLVRVGNFLGSSKDKIQDLAERQTRILEKHLPSIDRKLSGHGNMLNSSVGGAAFPNP